MDSGKLYLLIQKQIDELPKKKVTQKDAEFLKGYLGSSRKYLGAKTSDLVKIAKGTLKENNLDAKNIIELCSKLFSLKTFEEYVVGGKIFTFLKPEMRSQIPFSVLEKWLTKAVGWLEVDVICQSSYSGKEALENWNNWEKIITNFSKSDNISLRRASLVLQVRSAKEANDKKVRKLAFETIDKLKREKEVLITKAISWLLRNLTTFNKTEVKEFLINNEATLPRIAFRETMKKIETGKK